MVRRQERREVARCPPPAPVWPGPAPPAGGRSTGCRRCCDSVPRATARVSACTATRGRGSGPRSTAATATAAGAGPPGSTGRGRAGSGRAATMPRSRPPTSPMRWPTARSRRARRSASAAATRAACAPTTCCSSRPSTASRRARPTPPSPARASPGRRWRRSARATRRAASGSRRWRRSTASRPGRCPACCAGRRGGRPRQGRHRPVYHHRCRLRSDRASTRAPSPPGRASPPRCGRWWPRKGTRPGRPWLRRAGVAAPTIRRHWAAALALAGLVEERRRFAPVVAVPPPATDPDAPNADERRR